MARIRVGGQGEGPVIHPLLPLRDTGKYPGGIKSRASQNLAKVRSREESVRLKKPGRPGERKLHG